MVQFNGHFDGKVIKPDELVEIPIDTPLRVTIEPAIKQEARGSNGTVYSNWPSNAPLRVPRILRCCTITMLIDCGSSLRAGGVSGVDARTMILADKSFDEILRPIRQNVGKSGLTESDSTQWCQHPGFDADRKNASLHVRLPVLGLPRLAANGLFTAEDAEKKLSPQMKIRWTQIKQNQISFHLCPSVFHRWQFLFLFFSAVQLNFPD